VTRRLLFSYLTITVVVLLLLEVPLGFFYADRERERLAADVEHDANVIATLYEDSLEAGGPLDPTPADVYEDRTGARVVVVDTDGVSQVDTAADIPRDFSTRPEIAAALAGTRTSGTRSSDTLGTDLLYVAVPVASGGVVHGALRVTLDTADVTARIRAFWLALGGVAVVVLIAVVVIGWVIARSVTRPLRSLTADADRFSGGDLSLTDRPIEGPPEIRSLDATMNTMARRLDGLLSAQRAFVADASHQLRTPLTALRLRLENLQNADAADTERELELAIEETGRLTELVTNLLQLARADDRPERVDVELVELVADRIDTWTAVADELGVTLTGPRRSTAGVQDAHVVRVVRGAVEQILDNLLDNALAASSPGSSVDSRIVTPADSSAEAPTIELRVVDHGPGLSDAAKVDALRRFWRGDPTRPGTGLGLSIVEALAVSSGGAIRLEDTPGGGLTVVVTFPAGGGASSIAS
jgi:signal transduction histidine kinase